MQGKVALVTGGARRIGAAICRTLHARGYAVMVHYHQSQAEARALQDELNAQRADSVAIIKGDLLQNKILPSLVDKTVAHFGHLDLLVNNASSFHATDLHLPSDQDWRDLMGTNALAPLTLSLAAHPHLAKRKGCIVNIVDSHVQSPLRGYLLYTMGKAALTTMTYGLAAELAPDIRVNGVAPGSNQWPEGDANFDEVARQRMISRIPLRRVGVPDDIARTVAFLADDAPYITGQIIAVDGGVTVV